MFIIEIFLGLLFIYWLLPDGNKNQENEELTNKILNDIKKERRN